jgi:CubicO group peptidase (beta-lactamase class C family)
MDLAMKVMTAASLLFLTLTATSTRAQEASLEPTRAEAVETPSESVDAYLRRLMEKRHIPGVSVAVVRGGEVVLLKGYGLANVELDVPATEDTIYQLASVTKTFTSAAIMLLAEEGKLSLDDRITERLSDLPEAWKDVTARHLLNHTSGIKSYTSVEDFQKSARKDFAPREILDLVANEPLEFAPGEKWRYCNTGYFLLGMLIEEASGKPYGEFMAERVFKPLGMTHTRVNDLRAVIPGRAQGYQWDGKELRNGEYVSPTQPFAAGMLVSSVADLVKWDAALANHTLLDEPVLDQMWTPTRLNNGEEAGYGFGWETSKVNGHRRVSHGGGIPGFSTELARFPDDKLTVIVLTNAEGGHAGTIARTIAGLFATELAAKVQEPIADEDAPTTERLRGMLEGALRGEVDPELFTEQAKVMLVPRIQADRERLASFGALKTFQLLERKEEDGVMRLRYRAVLENETLQMFFALDKDGKIQGAGLRPED